MNVLCSLMASDRMDLATAFATQVKARRTRKIQPPLAVRGILRTIYHAIVSAHRLIAMGHINISDSSKAPEVGLRLGCLKILVGSKLETSCLD